MAFSLWIVNFENPVYIYAAIPLLVLLFFIIIINFVNFDSEEKKQKRKFKAFLFFTRSLIILLAVVALTNPFIIRQTTEAGDPEITLLIDNSSSMQLFDVNTQLLKENLEKEIPVTTGYIGYKDTSMLGDGIFRYLHKNSLLIVTDGNNDQESMHFNDVMAFANRFNTSISAIKLEDEQYDVAISITAPKTAVVDTDYHYTVNIHNVDDPVNYKIAINDIIIFDGSSSEEVVQEFSHTFEEVGYYKIVAEILDPDTFAINNKYYKVIEVVEKPKILYVSTKTAIFDSLLPTRYNVYKTESIPSDVSDFFAVIINDRIHDITEQQSITLENSVDNGDGLIVWGGMNSFLGPSNIDLLLPVVSGETEENTALFNFIILFDSSGIIAKDITDEELIAYDLLDILQERKEEVNVGIYDFSYKSHEIYPVSPISEVQEMKDAMRNFQDVTEIDHVIWLRPADLSKGLAEAIETFDGIEGNNNIIVITDGNIHDNYFIKAKEKLQQLNDMGVRVHSYSFYNTQLDDDVLSTRRKEISSLGRGMYITSHRDLNFLFEKQLIITNNNHFITHELDINAKVSGFNDVVAMPSARVLISTGTGIPIVTTNSYNKVCVVSTDDGEFWGGDIFKERNIYMVSRVIDWAIGDPNRKRNEYTYIKDTTINEEILVQHKGTMPETSRCNFLDAGDYYECSLAPDAIGFDEILGTPFAVNYDAEYQFVGYSEEILDHLTKETGGLMFPEEKIDQIIEKVKADAELSINKKISIDWWLLGAAVVIFLFEVLIRRMIEQRRSMKYR
jgi:hypothetical protein